MILVFVTALSVALISKRVVDAGATTVIVMRDVPLTPLFVAVNSQTKVLFAAPAAILGVINVGVAVEADASNPPVPEILLQE